MYGLTTKLEPSVYSIATQYFTRAGALFGVFAQPRRHAKPQDMGRWGTADLWIATGRGGSVGPRGVSLCMRLIPVHDGNPLPFAIHSTATEMTVETAYGQVRLCFAEPGLLLVRGENGLTLRVERNNDTHSILHRRRLNAWESSHSGGPCFVYAPVKGEFSMKAEFDIEALSTPQDRGEIVPGADGSFVLAIEEFDEFGIVRDAYPSYEEGLANVTADWNAFLAKFPAMPAFAAGRERAAYQLWAMQTMPALFTKRTQIWSDFSHMADSFETCFCAAAMDDPNKAVELLLSELDHVSPDGQIVAVCDDTRGLYQSIAAPAQGWALEVLMQRFDLAKAVPKKDLETLYEGFSRWVAWYLKNRDDDGDGVPQYEGCEESGYAAGPVFDGHFRAELPDLCAFLALLEEKLGDLAGLLGRDGKEREAWYASSRARIAQMIERFWNGARFIGRDAESGDALECESLIFYRPLILGKRLPQEILDAMAEDLSEGNGYLTPAGYLTQRMTSPEYNLIGAYAGRVQPAESALVTTGLLWAGKTAEAAEAAKRYCDSRIKPVSACWPVERGFPSSVTAAAFRLLADVAEA